MTTDSTAPRPEGDDAPAEPSNTEQAAPTPEAPETVVVDPEPPLVEPTTEPPLVEPATEPTAPESTSATAPEPVATDAEALSEPVTSDTVTAPASVTSAPPPAAGSVPPTETAPQVVYVDAPTRPKKRGTRGVGLVVVLLSTAIFAALYALATIALALALRPDGLNGFGSYLASAPFFVPVLVFAGAHLLLVLVANRAGWWIHVLGGFFVAVLVWLAFLGAALIAAGAIGATEAQQQSVILQQLVNPLGIIAAVLAREIPIWVGGIVSRRGRTQTARNAEAQAAYERDLAAHRASVRPTAPAS